MTNLCVVELTYVQGPEAADRHMEAHREFLRGGYEDGLFVASGRKVPRTGGVILARGSREVILERLALDPFSVHGVAEYAVTEFVPTMTSDELRGLRAEG
ncbi:YciI family protein [Falsarthrobacter nasiphocae]|uniref:Uncharacterized protein YciI n=1 Tax=Falsarthrobacter nasiphocae TaxID=189863 RepID=A0AAE3YHB0_9MICC|nr:YciI family protein [Falsarthrobacter nasiphocae]MDR6892190.1 uncharacterized protein YciI [Falsarthrobacter nasiphocae]